MSSFLAMGGYGAFVWPAFGVTALVMVWLLAASLHRLRTVERRLETEQPQRPDRRRARTAGGSTS